MAVGLPQQQPVTTEETEAALTAIYNWNYESEIDQIRTLYANALERQWIAVRDLDWEQEVDKKVFSSTSVALGGFPLQTTQFWKNLSADQRWEISRRTSAFVLSNFLHGEQGALMVAAQMVNAVPHMDGKLYAATQTMDEARHVEVFAAYIRKIDDVYPIMPSLKNLLDKTLAVESWMHKAVGMQVVVEGLALYMFRDMRNTTQEPLLKKLLTYVSRDEARHTGYGIKYLNHVVKTLSDRERNELEDFGFEAARLLIDSRSGSSMRDSALALWREAGIDPQEMFKDLAKERATMANEVRRTGGAFGPIRGFVIPTMRSIGLFSERLEGHFRDMFSANFGAERARLLEFERELPDDLEAWLEEAPSVA